MSTQQVLEERLILSSSACLALVHICGTNQWRILQQVCVEVASHTKHVTTRQRLKHSIKCMPYSRTFFIDLLRFGDLSRNIDTKQIEESALRVTSKWHLNMQDASHPDLAKPNSRRVGQLTVHKYRNALSR